MNSKKKGNAWENKLTNWLRDNGIRAWRDSQSGGGNREKGDVGNNVNMTIESKAAKVVKLPEWWRQTENSASLHGNTPVLFIHQDGMPDREWLVVMHSEDWKLLVKSSTEIDTSFIDPSIAREQNYALSGLQAQIKRVKKAFDL